MVDEPQKREVVLSLGSNIGDSLRTIQMAIENLSQILDVVKVSSFYRTEPVGLKYQNDFINAIVVGKTSLSPFALLNNIDRIEKRHGRVREIKFGPRTLDIDIIFYGDTILKMSTLQIPHPEFKNRLFVLVPLVEVAPDFVDPIEKRKVIEIFEERKNFLKEKVEKI